MKARVKAMLATLERLGSSRVLDDLSARYGIFAKKAYGVSMANLLKLAKQIGPDHDLAVALWETGWYEARMLATLIDDPAQVSAAQMERWCRDFDSWAICDTACFKLFDRVPGAWKKVKPWCTKKDEFVRRGGFALLACLALHDREAPAAWRRRIGRLAVGSAKMRLATCRSGAPPFDVRVGVENTDGSSIRAPLTLQGQGPRRHRGPDVGPRYRRQRRHLQRRPRRAPAAAGQRR